MMRSQVVMINYETLVKESDNRKRNRFACKQTTVQEKFEKILKFRASVKKNRGEIRFSSKTGSPRLRKKSLKYFIDQTHDTIK